MPRYVVFNIRGTDEMRREIQKLARRTRQNIAPALRLEADRVLADARERAPIRDNILRQSGHVREIRRGSGHQIDVIFDAKHALAVHENPSRHDPPSWRGVRVNFRVGGPKYLENALRESRDGMMDRLARDLTIE